MERLSSLRKTNNVGGNLVLSKFNALKTLTTNPIAHIEEMEEHLLLLPQTENQPNHYFGKDVYVKELFFKKGTVATGRVQRVEHVSILVSGHMTLWTPERGLHDVKGFEITEVKPGMKRAGYAHTDVHWLCAYGVRDVENYHQEELLDMLTFRKYDEYLNFINQYTIDSKEVKIW
jgi:hypothetical protein